MQNISIARLNRTWGNLVHQENIKTHRTCRLIPTIMERLGSKEKGIHNATIEELAAERTR